MTDPVRLRRLDRNGLEYSADASFGRMKRDIFSLRSIFSLLVALSACNRTATLPLGAACRATTDCAQGGACVDGTCIGAQCAKSADCGAGNECGPLLKCQSSAISAAITKVIGDGANGAVKSGLVIQGHDFVDGSTVQLVSSALSKSWGLVVSNASATSISVGLPAELNTLVTSATSAQRMTVVVSSALGSVARDVDVLQGVPGLAGAPGATGAPGMASGAGNGFNFSEDPASLDFYYDLLVHPVSSVTLSAPSDGYVVLTSTFDWAAGPFSPTGTVAFLHMKFAETTPASFTSTSDSSINAVDPNVGLRVPVIVTKVFAVTAGAHTYTLYGQREGNTSSAFYFIYHRRMTAQFYPTANRFP